MTGFASEFLAGLLAPFVGALMIANQRALFRLAIVPFVITVLILTVGLAYGLPFITGLVVPFTNSLLTFFGLKLNSGAGETLAKIFPFLIWPALALTLLFVLLSLTRLFASPFYSLLAERVLRSAGVLTSEKPGLKSWVAANVKQTRIALTKTPLFVVIGVVLGILSFIPGIGLFTSVAFVLLLAYDVTDYAFEALEWPLARRFEFFRKHLGLFLGLGCTLGLVLLIPGLNFFLLPASVCGASDAVRRMIR